MRLGELVGQDRINRERLPVDLHLELEKLHAQPISERTLVRADNELPEFPARALYEFWKRREE